MVHTRKKALAENTFFQDCKPSTLPKGVPKDDATKLHSDLDDEPFSDLELLMFADFERNDSLLKFFPRQEGCGQMKSIPFSYFTETSKPTDAVDRCRKFRLLTKDQQEIIVQAYRDRTDSQKHRHQRNLWILNCKKRKIARRLMTWDQANNDECVQPDASVQITPALGGLSLSEGRRSTETEPLSTALSVVTNAASSSPLAHRNAASNSSTARTVTPPPATTTPPAPTDMEVDEEDKENQHVGYLSAKDARDEAAKFIENKLKSQKRKSSEPATGLLQTGTMTVRTKVHQTQRLAAEALDTMQWKDRYPSAPKTTLSTIFVTQMKDPPQAGLHPSDDCVRERALVQVIAESHADLTLCFRMIFDGLKEKEHVELQRFYRDENDDDTGKGILQKVTEHIDVWEKKRERTKNTPLTPREIADEQAEYAARRRAQNTN